jgi:pimeloyl-ACP methyl ester carboxylesterase
MPSLIPYVSRLSAIRLALVLFFVVPFVATGRGQSPSPKSEPASANLQSFEGRYEASPGTIIAVRRQGESLTMEVNAGSPMEFLPESKDLFIHKQSGTKIGFVRDDSGNVTELVLHRGGEHRAKRISGSPSRDQIRTVDVDGTPFQIRITGEGNTTVVLVSGLENWSKVADGIQSEARIIRYQAGGPDGKRTGPPDIQTQARRLHDLLKTLDVTGPRVLVGHSFGGALTRVYAGLFPQEVAGLVLVDPFDEGFADWLKTNQPANYELFKRNALENYVSDWDDLLNQLRISRSPEGIPVVLLTAAQRQIRDGDELEAKIARKDFEEGSRAVMNAHRQWIAKIPKGRQVVVPDAGHEIPRERPEYVIEAIKQTLNELKAGPR